MQLGLSEQAASLVWLAGPISGLIAQPLIGALTSNSTMEQADNESILTHQVLSLMPQPPSIVDDPGSQVPPWSLLLVVICLSLLSVQRRVKQDRNNSFKRCNSDFPFLTFHSSFSGFSICRRDRNLPRRYVWGRPRRLGSCKERTGTHVIVDVIGT